MAETIMDDLMEWWTDVGTSLSVAQQLEDFAEKHADAFPDLPPDAAPGDVPEQTDEQHRVFQLFSSLIEGQIEEFVSSRGVSMEVFLERCQQRQDELDKAGEGDQSFLAWIFALVRYDVFYELMVNERKRLADEKKG
eukprot:TRINITY_DN30448_c0_g1_i1.p1 TRINITY_DN30448_c0_g1~~TRINITY_DN30448_c0_g1_i1.p1  ORF type:complete len:160 (+),score=52.93 TRINITY_DN30448_c0_g1_i1:71-481(+)